MNKGYSLGLFLLIVITCHTMAQAMKDPEIILDKEKNVTLNRFDTIICVNNDTIIGIMLRADSANVYFKYPNNKNMNKLSKMFIKTIHSRNGDIVTCSNSITPLATKKEFPLDAENNWTYIEIIYDKSPEMSGWKNVGPLAVRFTGDFKTSGDDLEKNCLIILKKKAVRLNADIIHITEKKIFREYGELPKIEMRAVAYIKE